MTSKEILQELASFFQKTHKIKKDYRSFIGNTKRLMESPLPQELSLHEKETLTKTEEFLNNWSDNYPAVFLKKSDLTNLQEKFKKWHQKVQTSPLPNKKPTPSSKIDWDNLSDKAEKLEEGTKWIDWYNHNKTWLKGLGIVLLLLLAWLVIRAIKEEIMK